MQDLNLTSRTHTTKQIYTILITLQETQLLGSCIFQKISLVIHPDSGALVVK